MSSGLLFRDRFAAEIDSDNVLSEDLAEFDEWNTTEELGTEGPDYQRYDSLLRTFEENGDRTWCDPGTKKLEYLLGFDQGRLIEVIGGYWYHYPLCCFDWPTSV